jgi:hypothetical protein
LTSSAGSGRTVLDLEDCRHRAAHDGERYPSLLDEPLTVELSSEESRSAAVFAHGVLLIDAVADDLPRLIPATLGSSAGRMRKSLPGEPNMPSGSQRLPSRADPLQVCRRRIGAACRHLKKSLHVVAAEQFGSWGLA